MESRYPIQMSLGIIEISADCWKLQRIAWNCNGMAETKTPLQGTVSSLSSLPSKTGCRRSPAQKVRERTKQVLVFQILAYLYGSGKSQPGAGTRLPATTRPCKQPVPATPRPCSNIHQKQAAHAAKHETPHPCCNPPLQQLTTDNTALRQ